MPDGSNVHQLPRPRPFLVAVQPRPAATVHTILDTGCAFDAEMAGFAGPTPPEQGGLRVMFDGRGKPTVVLTGQGGEVSIVGLAAISEVATALMHAEALARRMGDAPGPEAA